jgi:hypothetical protein
VVAVPADPKDGRPEVRVNLVALGRPGASAAVGVAQLLVLAALAWATWPRDGGGGGGGGGESVGGGASATGGGTRLLGELAAVFLAAVLLSPRSWKHHYVLLALPHAFLLAACVRREAVGQRLYLVGALAVVGLLCHQVSGEATLGERASDLAEAYGVFVWGGVALLAATVVELTAARGERLGAPTPPPTPTPMPRPPTSPPPTSPPPP